MERLNLDEMVMGLADKALNAVLDDAAFIGTAAPMYGGKVQFDLVLHYVAVIEEGLERLKTHLVCDFADGASASALARALGISRQTFYNRYSAEIKERDEELVPVKSALTLRFAHARLAGREASGTELTDRQGKYLDIVVGMLREDRTDNGRNGVIGCALRDRVIDAETIAWAADAFKHDGEPDAKPKLNERKPAASKLPENLIEEWTRFREEAERQGLRPTQEAFAHKYGVSRATLSRALKKAGV